MRLSARIVRSRTTALVCLPLTTSCATTTMWNDSILALGNLPQEAPAFEPIVHDPVDLVLKVAATPLTLTADALGMLCGTEVTAEEAEVVTLLGSLGVIASGALNDAAVLVSD